MTKLEKIKDIAIKVRKAFEEIEKKDYGYRFLDYDGNDYYIKNNLGGYCGRAAIQLFLACRRKNIDIEIEEGVGHSYNKLGDYIIDITATQFGKYPKVHIRKYKSRKPEYYQKVRTHLSTNSLANEFWIPSHIIVRDRTVVLKYCPGQTGGQRRQENVKVKCKSKEDH